MRELSEPDGALKLPDGRLLSYRIYGPKNGVPCFYFHGFPGSRLEAGYAEAPGLRLIAVDRPGYGKSSARPGRRLTDWPLDIAALADGLGLERFSLLGISGGAPYALACAWALGDRIRKTAIVCGIGPPEARGMDQGMMARLLKAGRLRFAYMPLALLARLRLRSRGGEEWFLEFRRRIRERTGNGVPKEAAAATDAFSRHLYRSWQEGFRHSTSGLISDARIYASKWPFALHEVKATVHLWHGVDDRIVPVDVGHYYSALLPNVETHIEEGEGHFSVILNSLPAIARKLTE